MKNNLKINSSDQTQIRFVVQVPRTQKNCDSAHDFTNRLQRMSETFEGKKIVKCESITVCELRVGYDPVVEDYSI